MRYKLAVLIPTYNQPLLKRAVESIPKREDIITLVCDDASTDSYIDTLVPSDGLIIIRRSTNGGPGLAMNDMLDYIKNIDVDYVVRLDSDDYFLPLIENIDKYLTGEDMIFYDLEINGGKLFKLSSKTKKTFCGATKFWKRKYIGDTRYPALYFAEDWYFNEELLKKNHTEKYLNIPLVHYNHPREGSLVNIGGKKNV